MDQGAQEALGQVQEEMDVVANTKAAGREREGVQGFDNVDKRCRKRILRMELELLMGKYTSKLRW